MSKVKWLIATFAGFVLLYGLAWLAITFSIAQYLNKEFAGKPNRIFGFGEDDYKIAFVKAAPDGFPFKLGIKIHNFSEESQSSLITHNEPIRIGYNLLSQRFYILYKGESLARPKPLESGFGTKITGEFAHYISYSLSPKLFKILRNPERGFELINFVESVEFTSKNVKAHDIIDKSLLLDESYLLAKLAVSGKPYYHSLDELKHNPPSSWHLTSSSKIDSAAEGKRVAVASVIYGILHSRALTHDIDFDLLTKAKDFTLTEFVKNSELKSRLWRFSDDSEDFDGNFSYQSIADDNNIDITLHYASSSAIKPNFFEKKIEDLRKIAGNLINMDGGEVAILKPALNAFLEDPKKFLPSKNNISKLDAALDLKLHGADNKFELNLENFSIFADDVGFRLQNTSDVDNLFAWKSSGILSLSKYKSAVDFITDYANQMTGQKDSAKIVDLNKAARNSFLRIISNHPESDSDELVFDYEFSSNLETGKIGVTTMPDVISLYYTTFYRKAIEEAKSAPDFDKELEELAPDLLAKPELLEKLREEKSL